MSHSNVTPRFAVLVVLVGVLAALGGCGSTATIAGGYADKATIVIAAKDAYVGERVALFVDGKLLQRDIEAVREDKATRKALRTDVAPGTHEVVVQDKQGKEIYRAKVFLSTGKSKVVVLP